MQLIKHPIRSIKLSKSNLAEELGVELVTEILDVDYEKTLKLIPQRWEKHNPQLVVHVGVSGQAECLTLEQLAFNTGYECKDIHGCCPTQHCCVPGGSELLHSQLPLASVCDTLNNSPHLNLKCRLSQDPGKYLCSFVYYLSLSRDVSRTVFVHVPPLSCCSAQDTALCLKEVLLLLYRARHELGVQKERQPQGGKTETQVSDLSEENEAEQTIGQKLDSVVAAASLSETNRECNDFPSSVETATATSFAACSSSSITKELQSELGKLSICSAKELGADSSELI